MSFNRCECRNPNRPSPCLQCRKHRDQKTKKSSQVKLVSAKRGRGRSRVSTSPQRSTVKGTRSLLDPRRQQHETISEMYVHIERLEKALAEAQKRVSSEPHPLLIKDSTVSTPTSIPSPPPGAEVGSQQAHVISGDDEELLAEAFGVMSVHDDGKAEFHGSTATSEYLLKVYHQKVQSVVPPDSTGDENENKIPIDILANHPPSRLHACPELLFLNVQFPCPPSDQSPPDMNRFLDFLPPYQLARVLLHNYFTCFSWLAMPIPNHDLERIFNAVYPGRIVTTKLTLSDAHRLGVLFMVFLLGTLYDLELDYTTCCAEAEDYHLLARAALAADPVTEHTTVHGVQAFILMIWYFRLFPGRRNYQWGLSGYLMRLVQAIGLHRNSRDVSTYIQDPSGRTRYEQTFWEYNAMDIWQSYMFGRPTSMTSRIIECKSPSTVDVHPGFEPAYYLWKYSFAHLVSDVIAMISAETVTYTDILKCEKDLRQHYMPPGLEWPRPDTTAEAPGKSFQRCIVAVWKQVSIMYIHRPYFWDAISKHPDDPSKSRYWHSVVTAHGSASTLVSDMRLLWLVYPKLIGRMAPFWSHAQSAALVLGALVSHSPNCNFAGEALRHFEETYDMFSEAKDSLQPSDAITAMQKLHRKARDAFAGLGGSPSQATGSPASTPSSHSSQRQHLPVYQSAGAQRSSPVGHVPENELSRRRTPGEMAMEEQEESLGQSAPQISMHWYEEVLDGSW